MSPELLAQIVSALQSFSNPDQWGSFDASGCPKMVGRSDESWVGSYEEHPLRLAAILLEQIRQEQK